MDILLNPDKKGIRVFSLPIINILGDDYRVFKESKDFYDTGSCQCNKDCNCSSTRGQVTVVKYAWYRLLKYDGTNKAFYSEPHKPKEY